MDTLEQYRQASSEARLKLRYAHERLYDMASLGLISGALFRERQDYLARCIDEWCALSDARIDEMRGRQQQFWRR
jgi:hypothetical protein